MNTERSAVGSLSWYRTSGSTSAVPPSILGRYCGVYPYAVRMSTWTTKAMVWRVLSALLCLLPFMQRGYTLYEDQVGDVDW